jgi:hypothetical protein
MESRAVYLEALQSPQHQGSNQANEEGCGYESLLILFASVAAWFIFVR